MTNSQSNAITVKAVELHAYQDIAYVAQIIVQSHNHGANFAALREGANVFNFEVVLSGGVLRCSRDRLKSISGHEVQIEREDDDASSVVGSRKSRRSRCKWLWCPGNRIERDCSSRTRLSQ